jgi:hypothetical protein
MHYLAGGIVQTLATKGFSETDQQPISIDIFCSSHIVLMATEETVI